MIHTRRLIPVALVLAASLSGAEGALAWGRDAHAVVGMLAADALDEKARDSLTTLLGDLEADTLAASCNWPDEIRDTAAGEGTSPWHYVNIPRTAGHYDRERDCPGGDCVTERIIYFAGRLGDERLDDAARREAFNWLCHLVGDLHQPLHAGFADDRGGNSVDVRFRGEDMDLHEFWDDGLKRALGETRESLYRELSLPPAAATLRLEGHGKYWAFDSVARWTDQSHALARTEAYPPGAVIDEAFAERAWATSRDQILTAAARLASILNAVVGGGEVLFAPHRDERN